MSCGIVSWVLAAVGMKISLKISAATHREFRCHPVLIRHIRDWNVVVMVKKEANHCAEKGVVLKDENAQNAKDLGDVLKGCLEYN